MTLIKIIFWILIICAIVIAGPLLTLWSLNTLFPALAIPYDFYTWIAVIILAGVFKSTAKVAK